MDQFIDTVKEIERVLVSVYDKHDLIPFMDVLSNRGAEIISTGGTAKTLREAKLSVTDVSTLTGFPECFDGRVKTLHPKVHGGLLFRRDNPDDVAKAAELGIKPIDMLVVNLYPFMQKVATGADWDECIENIDIGGPAMIRAAAKNSDSVAVITSPGQYELAINQINTHGGLTGDFRRWLMHSAFLACADYDTAIAAYLFARNGEAKIPS